jgi:hypothetical protein
MAPVVWPQVIERSTASGRSLSTVVAAIERQDGRRGQRRARVGQRDGRLEERPGRAFGEEPLHDAVRMGAGGELLRVGLAVGVGIGVGIGHGEDRFLAIVERVVVAVEDVRQVEDEDVVQIVGVAPDEGGRRGLDRQPALAAEVGGGRHEVQRCRESEIEVDQPIAGTQRVPACR